MKGNALEVLTQGTYVLISCLEREALIGIGRLGRFSFPPGYYAYAGSAFGPGGLAARLKRHLQGSEASHWHIDYLRKRAEVREIWASEGEKRHEHLWASALGRLSGNGVPGFGSSDCRCKTHLYHFERRPLIQEFRELLSGGPDILRLIPG